MRSVRTIHRSDISIQRAWHYTLAAMSMRSGNKEKELHWTRDEWINSRLEDRGGFCAATTTPCARHSGHAFRPASRSSFTGCVASLTVRKHERRLTEAACENRMQEMNKVLRLELPSKKKRSSLNKLGQRMQLCPCAHCNSFCRTSTRM